MNEFFSSMLSPWQWLLLSLIPPAIVALYFLKLRRQPLEVPSTYLWHRTIEDMHVNSLWQKLRHSLLLLLQLLLVALLMLACLRPNWRGQSLTGDRLVILVDASASMNATDEAPSRLDVAKQKGTELIDRMQQGDAAMIISFSDQARVEQPFTTNRRQLRQRLQRIAPTSRASDISEALRAAAGLANPGRSGDTSAGDAPAADALPASLFILSDGGFRAVPNFSMGNLQETFIPLGKREVDNVGIVAFSAEDSVSDDDQLQALVQVQNFGGTAADVEITLELDGQLVDAMARTIEPGQTSGVNFSMDRPESGRLTARVSHDDVYQLDNIAYAAINPPSRANVMIVSDGNDALETVLRTSEMSRLSAITLIDPASIKSDDFQQQAASGRFDLIVFDRCAPEVLPRANTLFIGGLPPGEGWQQGEQLVGPQLIDTDVSHPLMKYLDFGDVAIAEGRPITAPPGQRVLLDSDGGALCVIAPREGFEDVVLGFVLIGTEENGDAYANTNWPLRLSFPLFCRNLIDYFGGPASAAGPVNTQPGEHVVLREETTSSELTVVTPSGRRTPLNRQEDNNFVFHDTGEIGIYTVEGSRGDQSDQANQLFTVNLFDPNESNIALRESFDTAWTTVKAQTNFETKRREAWPWIVLLAIAVLLGEWYVFNKRVHL